MTPLDTQRQLDARNLLTQTYLMWQDAKPQGDVLRLIEEVLRRAEERGARAERATLKENKDEEQSAHSPWFA